MSTATAVRERPILMSDDMSVALRDGRKTQTRRVANPQDWQDGAFMVRLPLQVRGDGPFGDTIAPAGDYKAFGNRNGAVSVKATNGKRLGVKPAEFEWLTRWGTVGDRLWVREAWGWATTRSAFSDPRIYYRADHKGAHVEPGLWRPSIHMRREHSRITLEIYGIRLQRLHEISIEDAQAEGAMSDHNGRRTIYGYSLPVDEFWRQSPVDAYMHLWEKINGPGSWALNPWVFALSFRVLKERS